MVDVAPKTGPARLAPPAVLADVCAPKRVTAMQFGLMRDSEAATLSELQVLNRELYELPQRTPQANGVLDRRLGISDKKGTCTTCGRMLADCPGHFGHVKLELPVFHVGYFKHTITMLQCICKTCSRVLLDDEDRRPFARALSAPSGSDPLRRKAILKKVNERCKKVSECPWCEACNGFVKKAGCMKIVHEKYRDASHPEASAWRRSFGQAAEANAELAGLVPKAADELNPLRVQQLLRNVLDEDVLFLNMDTQHARPEQLLVSTLLVPPVCIRPSVLMDASVGSNEDDLTIKLSEIIHINNIIRNALEKGAPITTVMEDWDFLQIQVAIYFNSQVPGLPSTYDRKPIRSLCQRLKGKTGRFRGNLSGKRVDFSARTVISPDPNVGIHEVCIPVHVAQVLTFPERACAHNLSALRRLVLNGPDVHPGANYVEGVDGSKRSLKYGDRRRAASELRVGDVIERHLHDGDVVLFNRQPSLHKLSIMAHRARVMPSRTFRFNECVCAPYNADFDGDEMNVHLPQTEEARAEASELMGSMKNIVTPRNGEPIIAATQDFITGAYTLTRKNVFLTRDKFAQLCAYCADASECVELPAPAILKPVELWTGKQVVSVLLRPSAGAAVSVSMEGRNRSYTGKGSYQPGMLCPADGWIVVHKSEHLAGSLDKSAVGSGSKDSLFAVLLRQLSPVAAGVAMGRLAKLTSRFLANQGFSIGISDVTPSPALTAQKAQLVAAGNETCHELIRQFHAGKLTPAPGCNAEQTLEAKINGVLSQIRSDAGKICKSELHWLNAPLIMAVSGSKGSDINISQMVACVGQQTVSGKRAPDGFVQRALPHFARLSREPAAKGFVSNSFFSGLTATEFFFHTMGGREGLVDTAVKTAETGYMQRRLMKALEDLHVHYDATVRNSEGAVVQLTYGDDGYDPAEMEAAAGRPVHFARTLAHLSDAELNAARATAPGAGARGMRERAAAAAALAKAVITGQASAELPIGRERMAAVLAEELWDHRLWGRPAQAGGGGAAGGGDGSGGGGGRGVREPAAGEPGAGGTQIRRELEAFVEELAAMYDGVGALEAAGPEGDAGADGALDEATRTMLRSRLGCVTEAQLRAFTRKVSARLNLAMIEPGSAVGAIGAQSIGEPGTQMTLKTFHFAGVASMNVTLGVPRIKEIVNGARTISTPIITAELICDDDVIAARNVKGRVEKTSVGSVCSSVAIVIEPHEVGALGPRQALRARSPCRAHCPRARSGRFCRGRSSSVNLRFCRAAAACSRRTSDAPSPPAGAAAWCARRTCSSRSTSSRLRRCSST